MSTTNHITFSEFKHCCNYVSTFDLMRRLANKDVSKSVIHIVYKPCKRCASAQRAPIGQSLFERELVLALRSMCLIECGRAQWRKISEIHVHHAAQSDEQAVAQFADTLAHTLGRRVTSKHTHGYDAMQKFTHRFTLQ